MIVKDLLCESLSYLDDAEDILHSGQVCIDWNSSINNHVPWSGCTTINYSFIHSKYLNI